MPIVNFFLVPGAFDDEPVRQLLKEASIFYVETLYPGMDPLPLDRVRAFVTLISPGHWATAGVPVSEGGEIAPFFTCLALEGRPQEQLERLMAGFTDLIEQHLHCRRGAVRGQILSIDPAHWSIGGEPASRMRANEAQLRREGGRQGH